MPSAPSRIASASCPTLSLSALFLMSVLGLFLEMMLIRWVSTEISIFAYLQNTVLVVCFLGLGMGCWTCRKPVSARNTLVPLAILVALLALPWTRHALNRVSQFFSVLPNFPTWSEAPVEQLGEKIFMVITAAFLTFLLMVVIWQTFVPLGRLLGRLMNDYPQPIKAYSVNVAGSLIGIWLFVLLSSMYMPPVVWCSAAAVLAIPFVNWRRPSEPVLLAAIVGFALLGNVIQVPPRHDPHVTTTEVETVWSPYQKLTLETQEASIDDNIVVSRTLKVNSSAYLWLLDLRPETVAQFPSWFDPKHRGLGYYDIPSLMKPNPKRMLVVGAGGGNDVAGGLRGGAGQVVAVEIDPAIIRIGQKYHPEHPYDNPRVSIVNDDARAFFANSNDRFDLIVFGLLDSHTTTAMTNARLDHYVYTRESLEQAKKLLADKGVVVLNFEATRDYIGDRMHTLVRDAFEQEPISFRMPMSGYGPGGLIFVTGKLPREEILQRIHDTPGLEARIEECRRYDKEEQHRSQEFAGTTQVTTDDWPYVYLEHRTIPILFGVLALLMIGLYFFTSRLIGLPLLPVSRGASLPHFFFLGAAFMLLETQNISQASVALGNTWDVNAVIVSCIMVFILMANAIAASCPRLPIWTVYIGLIGTCLALYGIDLAWFNHLPYAARAVVVGGLTCLPILFSGIVFIRSFAAVKAKDAALGANLLGALVGGLLQCITYLTGIHALLLIVAALYSAAALLRPVSIRIKEELITNHDEERSREHRAVEPVGV